MSVQCEPQAAAPFRGSEALQADAARRAGAARAIGIVLAAILGLVLVVLATRMRPPTSLFGISVIAILGFLACAFMARNPENASRAGASLVLVLFCQHIATSLILEDPTEIANVALFTGLSPLVAAATMRTRGTVIAGIAGLLVTALQLALHFPRSGLIEAFITPGTYYLATWAVGTFSSLASNRALEAHARQEARAQVAQDAARSAEVKYELMAEHMRDIIGLIDENGAYLFASPSHARVLGVDPLALMGQQHPELVHPEDLSTARAAFSKAKDTGSAACVVRMRLARGDCRFFHVAFSRVVDAPGAVLAVSARDIHEERSLSAAIEAAHRMEALGRLAGGVAHDFNNFLMVMRSCTDLLTSDVPPNSRAHADLNLLREAVSRASELTSQLLVFARQQVSPPNSRSSPARVARSLEPILRRLCGPRVVVTLESHGAELEVDATPVQIEQVLMNLVSNARDAMPDGGNLRVEIGERELAAGELAELSPGRYVELIVEDSGNGMTPDVRARMFEPFFTTKPLGRGSGLGLATVFGLVSQLHGHIAVQSEVGRGTTFRLFLPESKAPVLEAVRPPALATDTQSALRVLVVDDEPDVRSLMVRILRSSGHEVTEAASMGHALQAAEAPGAHFDGIVTDVMLGATDGIEMLERFQGAQPSAGVVVVSGFLPSPERARDIAQRGAEFLPKPFGAPDLLAALGRARSLSNATVTPKATVTP